MSPTKTNNDRERIARVDLMMRELAALQTRAFELVEEVRERAQMVAAELEKLNRHEDSN